jgi:rod shape-determining protein MreB
MGKTHDVAMDLGTANVRVCARGRGIVADEPSVVRVSRDSRALRAVGASALVAAADEPSSFTLNPLRGGVVVDVRGATWLLAVLLRRARGLSLTQPRVLACVPSDAAPQEVEALREALAAAGARPETIVAEPVAAAIGAGLDLSLPYAQMIVDIGEGVTDVAVIRQGWVEARGAVRMACSDLRAAVSDHVAARYEILLAPNAAQSLLEALGADDANGARHLAEVRGRRMHGAEECFVTVERRQLAEALDPLFDLICAAVNGVWQQLPPKLSCHVIENGVCLTGGTRDALR